LLETIKVKGINKPDKSKGTVKRKKAKNCSNTEYM